ncbi:MAG: cupin domain-containing protein [Ignavibacteriaceae bacterium]
MNQKLNLKDTLNYQQNAIVSKQLIKKNNGNVTLFAFDKNESLSEHTSAFEALIIINEGKLNVNIGGADYLLEGGEMILLPPNIPHSLYAKEKSKMILVMIK